MSLPGDPNYPPGVSERHISYPEPETCPVCHGEGESECTPCCGSPYVDTGDDFQCFRCRKSYTSRKCTECKGEGVVQA